ncbi:hypothetical protein BS47DRAFT_1393470 [Hydnum rufescens UP504]|uniref:Uncharacterized protein n=1 Tax=Hydnum rufescens UP504 TaxID=1448309 RepID=A0A9P6AWH5_9AGAM|nr:hypothetical protein BS47DRAFT_1393470 [Hydnum rufescens UP504]
MSKPSYFALVGIETLTLQELLACRARRNGLSPTDWTNPLELEPPSSSPSPLLNSDTTELTTANNIGPMGSFSQGQEFDPIYMEEVPGIHPTYRPSSSASRNIASMFVYLAMWCVIQGIVIEKAWFQDHSSNVIIKVAVEGLRAAEAALGQHMSAMIFLQISLRKEKFFHHGWPQWLTTATATAVRTEDAWWNVLASNTTLGSAYHLFRPHPPLPLNLAHTPDIPVGWYLPLSSSSTPTALSADSPAVADVATSSGAPSIGDKRKHVPDEDSGASMPPTKRFKGADVGPTDADPGPTDTNPGPTEANPGPTEANPGLTEADPGIVGDEMEGVEHPLGDGDVMDIDTAVDGVERALNHDDTMDVDLDTDDLNERIRHHMLRVPLLEFVAVRITYLL